ncbi:hypothetical protein B0H10DRAFT_2189109 [Mycena sp. CBHHK59/15]|nr:hypothetical protein B0H10DRAFT_2189109 [Mycena sp. CBHHK59/15]
MSVVNPLANEILQHAMNRESAQRRIGRHAAPLSADKITRLFQEHQKSSIERNVEGECSARGYRVWLGHATGPRPEGNELGESYFHNARGTGAYENRSTKLQNFPASQEKHFCAVCNKYINLGDGGDKNFIIHENGAAHRAKLPATARAPGDTKPLTSFFALKPRVPAASSSGNPPTASSSTKTAVPALPLPLPPNVATSSSVIDVDLLSDDHPALGLDIAPNPVESDPCRALLTWLHTAISTLPTTTPVALDNDLLTTFSVNPTTLIAPSQDPWEDVLHGLIDSFTYEGGKPRSTTQLSTLIRRGDLGMNGFAKWIEACFFELNIPLGALEMRVEHMIHAMILLTTGAALGYKKPSLRMLSKSGSAMRIAR